LPTPNQLAIVGDDRNAVLEWNGGYTNGPQPNPDDVGGYLVKWWPADDPSQISTRITSYRRLQLQPLDNARNYVATVAAIANDGSISAPSASVNVTPSSSRVNGLRSRMNAFFDDFNLPQGLPDELKWDTAFAGCNTPQQNAFFINAQFHAHNNVSMIGSDCVIGQTASRARALLDLSDSSTRSIVFDFDGDFRRDFMYVQLAPRQPWVTYQGTQWRQGKSFRQFGDVDDVPGQLMLGIQGQGFVVQVTGPDGRLSDVAKGDLAWTNSFSIPNVRRQWEVKLSTTSVEVFVDGKSLAKGAVNLAPTQYTVIWNLFSYNGAKANVPITLHHWDNFGFDGPANAPARPVTHNYRLRNGGTDRVVSERWQNAFPSVQLSIPDSLVGATERRLMFTLSGRQPSWDGRDKIAINGRVFAMVKPFTSRVPAPAHLNEFMSDINPYALEMRVPDGVLRTGVNTIAFEMDSQAVSNIHVEVDFARGTQPAYTPPAVANSGTGMPLAVPIGPMVSVDNINGLATWLHEASDSTNPTGTNLQVSGVADVAIWADNESTLVGTGSAIGIVEIGLLVDGQVARRMNVAKTEPTPSTKQVFRWDTTTVADGFHEVQAYACNKDGTASIFDIGGQGAVTGGYKPLYVKVTNSTGSTTVHRVTTPPDIAGLCRSTARVAALRALGGPATDRDLCLSPNAAATSVSNAVLRR
jgi:hypothetical protein